MVVDSQLTKLCIITSVDNKTDRQLVKPKIKTNTDQKCRCSIKSNNKFYLEIKKFKKKYLGSFGTQLVLISSPVATFSITVHGTPVFPLAIATVRLCIPSTNFCPSSPSAHCFILAKSKFISLEH
ncbi:hypothetical protein DERF_005680 [Dermatophagoides farinae]|uniref:Uncharacterized protein n=1 Tax=Dermatophagoides farinae TaxID=6954 RepID=A0A922I5V9_DERFA|nr:hypothetical protein DERF_005680 [Dermatophagoides farinae]